MAHTSKFFSNIIAVSWRLHDLTRKIELKCRALTVIRNNFVCSEQFLLALEKSYLENFIQIYRKTNFVKSVFAYLKNEN